MTGGYAIEIIARPETAAGFALAGLAAIEAPSPRAGAERLVEAAARSDCGIVLVEEPIWEAVPEAARRALERRPLPMIVPFPGPAWEKGAAAPEAYLVEILRRAIGYRVRLP